MGVNNCESQSVREVRGSATGFLQAPCWTVRLPCPCS